MLGPWWLLTIGMLSGLVTRTFVGGKAYGAVADALLGITGAFFVDWMLGLLTNTMSWSNSTLFTIWGAAALPLLAHLLGRRKAARRLYGASSAVGLSGKDLVELTDDSPTSAAPRLRQHVE